MTHSWEVPTPDEEGNSQESSIPIQQDQVREWAEKNGVEIVREFADHGESGRTAED